MKLAQKDNSPQWENKVEKSSDLKEKVDSSQEREIPVQSADTLSKIKADLEKDIDQKYDEIFKNGKKEAEWEFADWLQDWYNRRGSRKEILDKIFDLRGGQ